MPALSEDALAQRRDDIVHAALRCFARQGYRATSMRDLCREAGLSIGGIYAHFRSKEAILDAIAEMFAERRHEFLRDLRREEAPPLKDVLLRMTAHLDTAEGRQENAADISLLGEAVHTNPLAKVMAETDKDYFNLFAELADGDEAKGIMVTALLYGLLILSAFHPGLDREAAIHAFEGVAA